MTDTTKKPRGFAAMTPEKALEIRRKGGASSPANFKNRPPEERRAAGAKGGASRKLS